MNALNEVYDVYDENQELLDQFAANVGIDTEEGTQLMMLVYMAISLGEITVSPDQRKAIQENTLHYMTTGELERIDVAKRSSMLDMMGED